MMNIFIKIIAVAFLFNIVFATNDYGNVQPMEMMEYQQNANPASNGMTRMLRDSGWRHIGLGKRSAGYHRNLASGKTWAMIGLGR